MNSAKLEYIGSPDEEATKMPSEHLPNPPDAHTLPEPISWEELAKPVDMSDNLLGDRFCERGQAVMLYGPAGCGKSIAAMQATAEWAAGLKGLHIAPQRPLKTVVLQTEDSVNDLRETMDGILQSSCFSEEHLALVRQNLIILPQIPGGGGEALTKALNEIAIRFKPDMVTLNPLLAFCEGDPTRDLGKLLYQVIDPVLKRHRFGFFGIHHTPKMNGKDTSGYGAHDHQYLAAGDARVANWPRGMIQIEPIGGGVYCFRCAKRGSRAGWTWDLKPTNERYYKWAKGSVRWVDAIPDEVEVARSEEPYQRLLEVLPDCNEEGISRDRVITAAKSKLNIGKTKAESSLALLLEDGLAERCAVMTASKRKAALFRRSQKCERY